MLKLNLANLRLFAHKKGGVSTSNGRDSDKNVLELKQLMDKLLTGIGLSLYRQLVLTSTQCERWTWWRRCCSQEVEGIVRFER